MPIFNSYDKLRARNLRDGDEIHFVSNPKVSCFAQVDFFPTVCGVVYGGVLSCSGSNREIFRVLGLIGDYPNRQAISNKLACAICGVPCSNQGDWPIWGRSSSGEASGLWSVWQISLALMQHLEGEVDIRSYLVPENKTFAERFL